MIWRNSKNTQTIRECLVCIWAALRPFGAPLAFLYETVLNEPMEKGKFYITTTLPYVNAKPHIGFALEIVQADAVARFRRPIGDEVFFNFGTDEHGQKIYQKALEEGKNPQAYTDEYAVSFDALKQALNLSYDAFIRTTDPHHKHAAQE